MLDGYKRSCYSGGAGESGVDYHIAELAHFRAMERNVNIWLSVRAAHTWACILTLQYWEIVGEWIQADIAYGDLAEDSEL